MYLPKPNGLQSSVICGWILKKYNYKQSIPQSLQGTLG